MNKLRIEPSYGFTVEIKDGFLTIENISGSETDYPSSVMLNRAETSALFHFLVDLAKDPTVWEPR